MDTIKQIKIIILTIFILTQLNNAQNKTDVYLEDFGNTELKEKIEKNASEFLTKLNITFFDTTDIEMDETYITEQAKASVESLWENAPFFCGETEIITAIVRREGGGGYEIRNIPLTLKVNADSNSYQEGVLILTPSGNIDELYFGLEQHQYNRLLRTGKGITDFRRRQLILNFVENFRTAYNRKDLDLLTKVFSDNALIIVGHVIKEEETGNNLLDRNFEKSKVEFIRFSKKEYLDHLKDVFAINAFIDVGFENIDIVQHRLYHDIYGVQMKQYWNSSTYSDKGYLFLMIDFKDEENPLIHVRAWQPDKYTQPDSAISLGDFEIIN